MELSYEQALHSVGLEPFGGFLGIGLAEIAEAAETCVGGGHLAIVVASVDGDVAAFAAVVVGGQTGVERSGDMAMAPLCPRRVPPYILWGWGRFHNAALMTASGFGGEHSVEPAQEA